MSQVCCSHSKISRHTLDHPGGYCSEFWKCDTCESLFYPEQVDQTARNRRDYFAATIDIPWNAVIGTMSIKFPEKNGKFTMSEVALYRAAMRFMEADAMLAERNKPHA